MSRGKFEVDSELKDPRWDSCCYLFIYFTGSWWNSSLFFLATFGPNTIDLLVIHPHRWCFGSGTSTPHSIRWSTPTSTSSSGKRSSARSKTYSATSASGETLTRTKGVQTTAGAAVAATPLPLQLLLGCWEIRDPQVSQCSVMLLTNTSQKLEKDWSMFVCFFF